MFNWFKKKELKVTNSQVQRATVARAEVDRVDILKTEVERIDTPKLTRVRYTDTNEIVELDLHDRDVFDELMTCERPVEIMGFVH